MYGAGSYGPKHGTRAQQLVVDGVKVTLVKGWQPVLKEPFNSGVFNLVVTDTGQELGTIVTGIGAYQGIYFTRPESWGGGHFRKFTTFGAAMKFLVRTDYKK